MIKVFFNKRAAISVVAMVMATLLLFISILATISYSSSKISENFDIVLRLNNVYAEEKGYENTLYLKLVESFLNSYQKVLADNSLSIGNDVNLNIGEKFRTEVDDSFRKTDENANVNLKELFSKVDPITFDGKNIYVKNSVLKKTRMFNLFNSDISYIYDLDTSVGFDRLELPSFDKIVSIQVICNEGSVKDSEAKSCLEQELSDFVVSIVKEKQLRLVSKDEYYVNKEMKKIEFLLSFDYTESESL